MIGWCIFLFNIWSNILTVTCKHGSSLILVKHNNKLHIDNLCYNVCKRVSLRNLYIDYIMKLRYISD